MRVISEPSQTEKAVEKVKEDIKEGKDKESKKGAKESKKGGKKSKKGGKVVKKSYNFDTQDEKEICWHFLLPDVSTSLQIVDGFILNWDARIVRHCSISLSKKKGGSDEGWVKEPKMHALFTCHGDVEKRNEEIKACAKLAHDKEKRKYNTFGEWAKALPE
ncbi:hypothetical protein TrRE_jg9966, partial [Triparma retinervis]